MVTATAPGKIILFGEHAVVYGRPAIAVPLSQVRATAVVEAGRQPGVHLFAPDLHLETTLALVVTYLIEPGHLDWSSAISKLTINPSRALGLNKGTLKEGADADITIIDPDIQWTVVASELRSKSMNTPFDGQQLKGRAECVIVGGETRYRLD